MDGGRFADLRPDARRIVVLIGFVSLCLLSGCAAKQAEDRHPRHAALSRSVPARAFDTSLHVTCELLDASPERRRQAAERVEAMVRDTLVVSVEQDGYFAVAVGDMSVFVRVLLREDGGRSLLSFASWVVSGHSASRAADARDEAIGRIRHLLRTASAIGGSAYGSVRVTEASP